MITISVSLKISSFHARNSFHWDLKERHLCQFLGDVSFLAKRTHTHNWLHSSPSHISLSRTQDGHFGGGCSDFRLWEKDGETWGDMAYSITGLLTKQQQQLACFLFRLCRINTFRFVLTTVGKIFHRLQPRPFITDRKYTALLFNKPIT